MKKIFISILALLYMGVSSGIAMEIHYCMGKKAGVELYGSASNKCGTCGMKDKSSGCCHDEHKFYKLSDSHKIFSGNIHFAAFDAAPAKDHYFYDVHWTVHPSLSSIEDHASPPGTGPSACILNCIFRL